ncbi:MAG TPA: hypothetical protein VFS62_14510 [Chloroflexota bacterium]|nr:hypothetical protein [Chloroflexota bacterium]
MRLWFALPLALALPLVACGGSAAVELSPSASASASAAASASASAGSTASLSAQAGAVGVPSGSGSGAVVSPTQPLPASPTVVPKPPASSPAPVNTGQGGSALSPAVTITTQDDGKTFHVRVGQVVDVALQAAQGMANWEVQNPDPAILAPTVNPAAAAARGVTLRAFKAVAQGQADVMATDRPMCNPGVPCPQFIRALKATVVVDP